MFASTGDTGAGCPAVSIVLNGVTLIPTPMLNYPSVSSYATAVGGTVLYFNDATASTPASRAFEYSWNYTGGGDSKFIAAGVYQNTNPTILLTRCATDPHGTPYPAPGPLCRGIPDVAAQSGGIISNGYKITSGGKNDQPRGGPRQSPPLSLEIQPRTKAAASSRRVNGLADPDIYRLANNTSQYSTDCRVGEHAQRHADTQEPGIAPSARQYSVGVVARDVDVQRYPVHGRSQQQWRGTGRCVRLLGRAGQWVADSSQRNGDCRSERYAGVEHPTERGWQPARGRLAQPAVCRSARLVYG